MDKFEMIRRIKLELSGLKINPSKMAEEGGLENACWEGYEPIGLKDDGSPNCVPIKEEQSKVKTNMSSMIVCKECGHSWEIEDGGDDTYICHICGCDNSPEKKQITKEGFPIPSPDGEDEQTYISKCISKISAEYTEEGQAYAICKAEWDK